MKLIAEVGSNWKNYEDLLGAPALVKETGATAIKYQYFTSKELYGKEVKELDKYHVPLEVLQECKKEADKHNVEFMCSAFSYKGLEEIDPLVKTHKIASSESNWKRFIGCAIVTGKDIVISTGGMTRDTLRWLCDHDNRGWDNRVITTMFCDPHYPSIMTEDEIYLSIKALKKEISMMDSNIKVGYSDHTLDANLINPIVAMCSVIEKHWNPYNYRDTPDATHALSNEEFKHYTDSINKPAWSVVNVHSRVEKNGEWFRPHWE